MTDLSPFKKCIRFLKARKRDNTRKNPILLETTTQFKLPNVAKAIIYNGSHIGNTKSDIYHMSEMFN